MNRVSILVFACTIACASTPPKADAPAAPPPALALATIVSDKTEGDIREVHLSNGLEVLLREDHAAPVATFVVYYRVGSRNEHGGITGSAHLLEHLQFKGTTHFPGRDAIWGELSRIGANFNATTSYDRTNYFETLPAESLPFAIALEADRMRNSTFTDADRQSEMMVVRNELERNENEPAQLLNQLLWSQSIISHPYHHPVIGWRPDVETVPTSQLREYYDRFYQPDNAVAVAVGDFKSDDVLRLIVEKFGVHPGGHKFPKVVDKEPEQRGQRRFVINKPGDMGLVEMGWRMPPVSSPDAAAIKALQLVLAGSLDLNEFGDPLDPGISNRLYKALMETQLATAVEFNYTLMLDETVGSITVGVRPDVPHQRVEDAIRVEIKRVQMEPVTDAELTRAKRRARAAMGLGQDGTFGQAMALGYFATIADWRLARDFADRISAVTKQDLQRVAKQYLSDKTLTVGWFVPEQPATGGAPNAAVVPRVPPGGASYRPMSATTGQDGPASAGSGTKGEIPASTSIKKKTLPNGLRIVVQENHVSPTFALAGSILSGTVCEKDDEDGLASVAADMLGRGTKQHTKLQLAEQLEDVGASLGFGGGFENTIVSGAGLKDDLDRVLDELGEDLIDPVFPPNELEKVVAEHIANVEQSEDSTEVRAHRVLMQGIYPKDSPFYVDDPAEVVRQLKSINAKRVEMWFHTWYGPDRMVITIVGDVNADEVFARIERKLGAWKQVGGPAVTTQPSPLPAAAARKNVFMPDKSSVDIIMGEPGALRRADPGFYGAMLANYVLGGPSGLLFRHVRNELGLTYGINSSLAASFVAGPWSIELSVNPNAVDSSINATQKVLADWHTHGVSEDDLALAKKEIAGLFQVGLGSNGGLANVLNQYEVLGLGAEYVTVHPRRIAATPLDAVNAAIPKYFFPNQLLTVVSGTVATPEARPHE